MVDDRKAEGVTEGDSRTESGREWADWSAHGYRKMYQPRSVLRASAIGVVVVLIVIGALLWAAMHHP